MGCIKDLPDVKGGQINDIGFVHWRDSRSLDECMYALQKHRVWLTAGDHGAIMVYRNDSDLLVCEFYRYLTPRDRRVYTQPKYVARWLKKWAPRVHLAPEDWK